MRRHAKPRHAWPFALASLALMPVALGACGERHHEPYQSAVAESDASPAIWRVSDEDSAIHLFGTIHVLPYGVPWWTPSVEGAFEESELLVTESNAWFGDSWSADRIIRLEGYYPQGERLRDHVKSSTRDRLTAVSEAYRLDLEEIDELRPWLAAWHVGGLEGTNVESDRRYGVETVLYRKAAEADLPNARLERAQGVLKALASLDAETQEEMLVAAIDDAEQIAAFDEMRLLIEFWLSGSPDDIDSLSRMSALSTHPDYYEILISARNNAWLDQLETYLEDDTRAFIAVGAAHLAGKDSVALLLEQRGYTVERIDPAGRKARASLAHRSARL